MEFDFDDSVALSPKEQEVLPGVNQLVKLSLLFISKVEGIISLSSADPGQDYPSWLEELHIHVTTVSAAVDELSSSVYAPQDRQELEKNFGQLKASILATFPTVSRNSVVQKDSVGQLLHLIRDKITALQLVEK